MPVSFEEDTPQPALLSVRQAARRLGIGESTLRQMLGTMNFKKIGGAWRISESDLQAWIDAQPASNAKPCDKPAEQEFEKLTVE